MPRESSSKQECIYCGSWQTIKYGNSTSGERRYRCNKCKKLFQESSQALHEERDERRREILRLNNFGLNNYEIARELNLSREAVGQILKKCKREQVGPVEVVKHIDVVIASLELKKTLAEADR